MSTLEILRDPAALAELAPAWDAVLARSACNRAFGSACWFRAWCEVAPIWEPWVFVARRGGEVAGVLALVRAGGGSLGFPGGLADYNDAVVARGDVTTAGALLAAARAVGAGLSLDCLRPDASLARALAAAGGSAGLAGTRTLRCPHADLSAGYSAYLESRGVGFRYRLRRARSRAEKAGVEIGELAPEVFPPAELPGLFLALHGERFARSCFDRPLDRAFAAVALPALFAERRLRVFAIRERGEALAISLCMVGDGSLGNWNGGWRAGAAHLSPGRLLLDLEIRVGCREGLTELDLMRGEEPYKTEWANAERTISRWSEVVTPA